MNGAQSDFLKLLLGIVLLLVVATAIGQVIRRRYDPADANPTIENLNARIAAWWGMAVLLAVAFLAGRAGVVILFAVLLLRRAARVRDADRRSARPTTGRSPRPSSWSCRRSTG